MKQVPCDGLIEDITCMLQCDGFFSTKLGWMMHLVNIMSLIVLVVKSVHYGNGSFFSCSQRTRATNHQKWPYLQN